MDRSVPKQRINALFGKYKYPILVLLAGLGLMLLPGPAQEPISAPVQTAPEPDLEARLETILSQIDGAGQVRVLLTLEKSRETLYQTDSRSDSADTVLVEDAERVETGLVRQTIEPVYRGAVILCQGAGDPGIRLAVVEAVRCVTGLGADEITVLNMK